MNYYNLKRNLTLGKTLSIEHASKDIQKKSNEISEDTIIRRKIHSTIVKLCLNEKKKDRIIVQLNDLFKDSKYDKYRKYFEIWVDNNIKNKEKESEECR